MLFRKMRRDMRLNLSQFISIFLMSILGVFVYTGIHAEWAGMETEVNRYYASSHMPDLWVYGSNFTVDDVNSVNTLSGVSKAARLLCTDGTAELPGRPILRVNIFTSADISTPHIVEGNTFDPDSEGLWLDYSFAKAHNIKTGDLLTINLLNTEYTANVSGLIMHPEYIHNVKDESTIMPDPETFGHVFITAASLENAEMLPYNQLLLLLDDGADADSVQAQLEKHFNDRYILQISRKTHPSAAVIHSEINQSKAIGGIFPVVFFLIAALSMFTTMTRLTSGQRTQIGILKAIGFSNKKILFHYVSYGIWIGLAGGITGLVSGPLVIPPILFVLQRSMYDLPDWYSVLSFSDFLAVILAIVCCGASSWFACRKELCEVPAAVLRPKVIKAARHSALEKSKLWLRLGFSAQWNLRDLLRNRTRSLMAILGVLGCSALFIFGLGLRDTTFGLSRWMYYDINRYESRILLEDSATEAEISAIAAEYEGQWISESAVEIKAGDSKETGTLSVLGDGDLIRFEDDKGVPVTISDNDICLTYKMADLLDIKQGDAIQWRVYGEKEWTGSNVTLLYRAPMGQGISMTRERYEDLDFTFRPTALLTSDAVPETAEIDGIKGVQSRNNLISSLDALLESIKLIIVILLLAAIILGCVVLYNLGSLSFTERIRELATLKVLGYFSGELRSLLNKQNIWITIIGILLGIPAGKALIRILLSAMSDSMDFVMVISPFTYIVSILGTFLLSMCISLFQARKIKGIDMVSSLKSVE